MQFETLLGGADAAGKRMEEITKFAASTPFESAELASTSKLLQTLGGDLLATGDGLRMVGDAAAISGQPIAEVGLHIGRVFNAITSGTSAGESIGRLQELGLMSGTVKRQFEDLAAAQKKGEAQTLTSAQALAKLREVFASTDGAMARLAATTGSKLSNLRDNVSQLQVAFGTGFNNGFRDALDATNNFLPQLQAKFTEAGEIVGSAISDAVAGDYERFALIGGVIGEAVVAGFKAVTISSLEGIGNSMLEHIAQAVENDPLLGGAPSLNDKGRGKNAFGDMIRENLTTAESSDNLAYRIQEELNKSEAPKILQQLQELNRTGKSQLEKLEKLKQFQNAKFTN
jgi:hypothetical protein